MSSLEFQLVREEIQTNWKEPELPWGGIPDITDHDIQLAYSSITHPAGALTLKAKVTNNRQHVEGLADWTAARSMKFWRSVPSLRTRQISVDTIERVGELAAVYYLYPKARSRKTRSNVGYCATSKLSWENYLKDHHGRVWNMLGDIEREATRQMRAFLYGSREEMPDIRRCQTCGHTTYSSKIVGV